MTGEWVLRTDALSIGYTRGALVRDLSFSASRLWGWTSAARRRFSTSCVI
jgi:hypothetical protein